MSGGKATLSIGLASADDPPFRNMAVLTTPGCILAIKRSGFSAARNFGVLTCASLELTYADIPGTAAGGRVTAPAFTPIIAAWDGFALGRKAFAVTIMPFTFIWREGFVCRVLTFLS